VKVLILAISPFNDRSILLNSRLNSLREQLGTLCEMLSENWGRQEETWKRVEEEEMWRHLSSEGLNCPLIGSHQIADFDGRLRLLELTTPCPGLVLHTAPHPCVPASPRHPVHHGVYSLNLSDLKKTKTMKHSRIIIKSLLVCYVTFGALIIALNKASKTLHSHHRIYRGNLSDLKRKKTMKHSSIIVFVNNFLDRYQKIIGYLSSKICAKLLDTIPSSYKEEAKYFFWNESNSSLNHLTIIYEAIRYFLGGLEYRFRKFRNRILGIVIRQTTESMRPEKYFASVLIKRLSSRRN